MTNSSTHLILADGRWSGAHGIGRFSTEILTRLNHTDIITQGPKPLSVPNLIWQARNLHQHKKTHSVYFTPGFNPVLASPMPYVMTICDLIHLHIPGKYKALKRAYYETLIKPSARKAFKVLTISEYSKQSILDWTGLPESQVINVSCGISTHLQMQGDKYTPGYPYLLHVGNTKPHKNVERLLLAFAQAQINPEIRLILTGNNTPELQRVIQNHRLENRVIFHKALSEATLASYYRGALALLFPSLYEGFGLPPLEAMACGTPALTSNTTSLLEVAQDAAVMVTPTELDSITLGIENIVNQEALRASLIQKGLKQASLYSWDKTAAMVQDILDSAINKR